MKEVLFAAFASLWALASCTEDVLERDTAEQETASAVVTEDDVASSKSRFAQVLSAAVAEHREVREFLKAEALKKFDKNYDVLYLSAKDQMVGESTFEQILASYSSAEEIEQIELNVPLLNIYLTRTDFLGILPEDLDVDDCSTPVAVEEGDSVAFYSGGQREFALPKGEIPDCHVLVVGENTRVAIEEPTGNKSLSARRFRFIDDAFDGSNDEQTLKSVSVAKANIGQRALDAYKFFYSEGGGITQKGLQRDYIYHGLTPKNTKGSLVMSVSEYIGFVKIPISAMYTFADSRSSSSDYADPYVTTEKIDRKGGGYTYDELVSKVWATGAFNFMFEVITANNSVASVSYLPLTPDDLWTISYTHTRKHKTWFHRTRNTYIIHVDKFEPKNVILKTPIDMGKWNVANESIYRYVRIREVDKGKEVTSKTVFDMDKMLSSGFSGDVKLCLGLKSEKKTEESTTGANVKVNSSNTIQITKEVTEKWTESSEELGLVRIYYYDPIIESITGNEPVIHTYNSGMVEFGIFVK